MVVQSRLGDNNSACVFTFLVKFPTGWSNSQLVTPCVSEETFGDLNSQQGVETISSDSQAWEDYSKMLENGL